MVNLGEFERCESCARCIYKDDDVTTERQGIVCSLGLVVNFIRWDDLGEMFTCKCIVWSIDHLELHDNNKNDDDDDNGDDFTKIFRSG